MEGELGDVAAVLEEDMVDDAVELVVAQGGVVEMEVEDEFWSRFPPVPPVCGEHASPHCIPQWEAPQNGVHDVCRETKDAV